MKRRLVCAVGGLRPSHLRLPALRSSLADDDGPSSDPQSHTFSIQEVEEGRIRVRKSREPSLQDGLRRNRPEQRRISQILHRLGPTTESPLIVDPSPTHETNHRRYSLLLYPPPTHLIVNRYRSSICLLIILTHRKALLKSPLALATVRPKLRRHPILRIPSQHPHTASTAVWHP